MQLPAHLRTALQRAHRADLDCALSDDAADALGAALLEVIGNAARARVRAIHRSSGTTVDDSINKREPEESIARRI